MRKILLSLFAVFVLSQPVIASGFGDFIENYRVQRNYKSVEHFIKSQTRYANRNNLEKFISTYDDTYVSCDGLDKAKYNELIRDVWSSYNNLDYVVDIKRLEVKGDNALAELNEFTFANLKINDVYLGELRSKANTVYKIRKDAKEKWKIISDEIAKEVTTMLYGSAQNLDIKLFAPEKVASGIDYTASLEFTPPEDTVAIASISADKVEYPQKPTKEVYRTMPDDNILERIFTSNVDNVNEYVIATIGLTKAKINDDNLQLKLTGFGYVIKRVNVVKEGKDNVKIE